jgi:hypothetical protein
MVYVEEVKYLLKDTEIHSEFVFSAMPKKIVNAKIACLDFSLQKAKMKLGVQVRVGKIKHLDYSGSPQYTAVFFFFFFFL